MVSESAAVSSNKAAARSRRSLP